MSHSYTSYTDIALNAFKFNAKTHDVIQRKQDILDNVAHHYNSRPTSILFAGFNPWILSTKYTQIFVTEISDTAKKFLDDNQVKYTYIDNKDLDQYKKSFSWVVTADEYFTFAKLEEEQRAGVEKLVHVAKDLVLTTLRDYKNQDYKEREFSQPLAVRNGKDALLFLEYNDYDFNEKNEWRSTVNEIAGNSLTVHGEFNRRSMYFKQLAKFSMDAGASNFLVHKNLMYKSLFKKNYEHVISIAIK